MEEEQVIEEEVDAIIEAQPEVETDKQEVESISEPQKDSVEEADSKEEEFEGVEEVQDIKKGTEKDYGL